MGAAKFFGDTLRTVSDMVDVVVVRAPVVLDRQLVGTASVGSVINGGDVAGRHPTQAIIELFAIEQLVGPIGELRMGLRVNLYIQACRWFFRLLNLVPPTEFVLVAPEGRRDHGVILSEELEMRTTWRDPDDASELDVLREQRMRTRPHGL